LLSVIAVILVAGIVAGVTLPERLPAPGRVVMYALVAAAVLVAYRLTRRGFWLGTEGIYRLIFEDAAAGIAITTPSLKFLEVNCRTCESLGYPREELLNMNLGDLLLPGDSAAKPAGFEDVLVTRETIVQEHRLRRKDGAQITLEISVRALRGRRLVVMFHDVTARREAEDALREREALAHSVVYTAVEGIVTADENGVIHSFNPAAERMFGYSAEEAIGSNLNILMPSPHREQHDQYIRDYLVGGIGKVIGIGREVPVW